MLIYFKLKNKKMGLFDFLKPKKISFNTAIIKDKILELSDKHKGQLDDLTNWLDFVIKRAEKDMSSKNNSFNSKDIINLSNRYYKEYHYQMIQNNDDEQKFDFIIVPIFNFVNIYAILLNIDKRRIVSQDLFKLDILLFHTVSSLYGALKFAYYDISGGQLIVEQAYPNYDFKLIEINEVEVDKDLKLESDFLKPKKTAEEYLVLGNDKHDIKDYIGALENYKKSIALNPDNAEAYFNRGVFRLHTLKDYEGAITDFTKSIKLNPDYKEAYFERAIAKEDLLDYAGAITDYTTVITLNPDYAEAYNNRGCIKFIQKDYTAAMVDLTKAITLNPDDAEVYRGRGFLKYSMEDFAGAITDYTKAIELNPDYADAYQNRGFAKFSLEDHDGAYADLTKAKTLNENEANKLFFEGYEKGCSNNYSESIADYTMAITLNPDHAEAYFCRGIAKDELQDHKGAIDDFTVAITLREGLGPYYNRGIAKAKLLDYNGAIADYTIAITMEPNDSNIYYSRGNAKYNIGQTTDACIDWQKAAELGNSAASEIIKKYCN